MPDPPIPHPHQSQGLRRPDRRWRRVARSTERHTRTTTPPIRLCTIMVDRRCTSAGTGPLGTPHGPDRHAAIIRAHRCAPAAGPVGMIGDVTVTAPNEPPTTPAATAGA